MTNWIKYFLLIGFCVTLATCELDEVPDFDSITFERNFGTVQNNEAALKAVQLSNGDYIVFGYGEEEVIKLSKTGQKINALSSSRWIEGAFKTTDDKVIFCGFDNPTPGSWVGIVTQIDSTLKVEKEVKTAATTTFPAFNWGFDVKPASDGTFKVMGINNNIPFIGSMATSFSSPPSVIKSYAEYSLPFRSLFVDRNNYLWFAASKGSPVQYYLISHPSTLDQVVPMLPFKIIGSQNDEIIVAGASTTTELPYILVRKFGNVVFEGAFGNRKGEFRDIVEVSDGFVAVGTVKLGKNGGNDLLLIKFSRDFSKVIWERDYGGNKDDSGQSIVATKDEGFLVVGGTFSFGSSGDFYVLKTNARGEVIR